MTSRRKTTLPILLWHILLRACKKEADREDRLEITNWNRETNLLFRNEKDLGMVGHHRHLCDRPIFVEGPLNGAENTKYKEEKLSSGD
jgi:hypothetical protein